MTRIFKSSAAATIFMGLAVLGSPVATEARQPARSIAVSHADLDLTTPQGRETIAARTERAVQKLCMRYGEIDLRIRMKSRQCISQTMQSAQTQIALAVANASRLALRTDIRLASD